MFNFRYQVCQRTDGMDDKVQHAPAEITRKQTTRVSMQNLPRDLSSRPRFRRPSPLLLNRDGILALPRFGRNRALCLGEAAVMQIDDGGRRRRRLVGDRRRAPRTEVQVARLELIVLSVYDRSDTHSGGKSVLAQLEDWSDERQDAPLDEHLPAVDRVELEDSRRCTRIALGSLSPNDKGVV